MRQPFRDVLYRATGRGVGPSGITSWIRESGPLWLWRIQQLVVAVQSMLGIDTHRQRALVAQLGSSLGIECA